MDKSQAVLYNLLSVTETIHVVSGDLGGWQLDQGLRESQSRAVFWLEENAQVCPIVTACLMIGALETWGRDDMDKSCLRTLAKLCPQAGLSIAIALTHSWHSLDFISTNFGIYNLQLISPRLYHRRTIEILDAQPVDWDVSDFEEFRLCHNEGHSTWDTPEELLPADLASEFCLSTGRLIHERLLKNPGKQSLVFLTSLRSECPLLSKSLCAWAYWNLSHRRSSPYHLVRGQLEEILALEFPEFLFFSKIGYLRFKSLQEIEDLFARLRRNSPEEFETLLQRCTGE